MPRQTGFTLLELMIVVAILGLLAAIGIAAYQTYSVRSQVLEGINLAANAKTPIIDAFLNLGQAPINRLQAGLTSNATDTVGNYVSGVEITNGRVDITFGNRAHGEIFGRTLSLTPYESADLSVVWRCGNAPPPTGLSTMGTAGGGVASAYQAATIDNRYLPSTCRP